MKYHSYLLCKFCRGIACYFTKKVKLLEIPGLHTKKLDGSKVNTTHVFCGSCKRELNNNTGNISYRYIVPIVDKPLEDPKLGQGVTNGNDCEKKESSKSKSKKSKENRQDKIPLYSQ